MPFLWDADLPTLPFVQLLQFYPVDTLLNRIFNCNVDQICREPVFAAADSIDLVIISLRRTC